MERLSKKEKGLMDMDNSVVIEGGYKWDKWQWEKYKTKFFKKKILMWRWSLNLTMPQNPFL